MLRGSDRPTNDRPGLLLNRGMARLYIALALLVALVLLVGGAYAYFRYSQNQISELSQQVTAIKAQADALDAANKVLRDDMVAYRKLTDDANTKLNEIATQANKTPATLAKHNLQNLASRKPKLIEDAINKSSTDFWTGLAATAQ